MDEKTDADVIREAIRYCLASIDIAEKFYDAATVHAMIGVIEILMGGNDADLVPECDCEGSCRRTAADGLEPAGE